MIGSDAYRVVIRLILVVFIMAASLRGDVINRGQFSSFIIFSYLFDQSEQSRMLKALLWLVDETEARLGPGSCTLQFKQLNLSSGRRPGSEDPHRRQWKLCILLSLFSQTLCWAPALVTHFNWLFQGQNFCAVHKYGFLRILSLCRLWFELAMFTGKAVG